jgi:hypothetical protein
MRATVQWAEAEASSKAPASAPAAKRYVGPRERHKMTNIEGKFEGIMPGIKLAVPSDARCYLTSSNWFLAGSEALAQCTAKELTSCVFLAAQSLECALKAYLLCSASDESKMKMELMAPTIRHDLEKLWMRSSELGLCVPNQPSSWCITLNSGHNKPYYMRYPMGGINITNPVIKTMLEELKAIVEEVGKKVK